MKVLNALVTAFIRNGKRNIAYRLILKKILIPFKNKRYDLNLYGKKESDKFSLDGFINKSLENCSPVVFLKKKRKRGQIIKIPKAMLKTNYNKVAKSLIDSKNIIEEIENSFEFKGKTYLKKIELHKQCIENRHNVRKG